MASSHLTDADLHRFRSKTLSAKELGRASGHMKSCDACARRLRESWQAPVAPALASDIQHLTYEDMTAVLDQSATVSQREWVEEHSRVCQPCSHQLKDLRDLDILLSGAEAKPAPQPVAAPKRAASAPSTWGFWAWVNGSLAAALAVAFVVLATVSRIPDDASAAASTHQGSGLPLDKPLVAIGLAIGVAVVFVLVLMVSRRRNRKDEKKRRKP
jgi:anti-sigma factor RsiW